MNTSDLDKIEEQYSKFPYPAPLENMEELIKQGYEQSSCPHALWYKLFPERRYQENLKVLIAGCGTNQAIYHALRHPRSEHYAIDVSEESLKHVANMIKKYNIKNLEIEKKNIVNRLQKLKYLIYRPAIITSCR